MKLKALLAILLVIGLLLIPCPPTVDANGWLDNYSCRKKIPITGSAGAGTDYQVPLTVYKDYSLEEQTASNAVYNLFSGDKTRAAQKLTISNRTVTKLSFYIYKVGNPTGDVTFTIRQTDDTVLASKVLGDASTLQIAATWEEATLDTPILVNEEVRISCEFSGGDAFDHIPVYHQNSDVKGSEQASTYQAGWTDQATDLAYKYRYPEDAAGIVGLGDYCTDFPNDIRFTDDDGSTELDHWIVDDTADPCKFWIKVDDDLDDAQDIYIYFGKSGASSDSNGVNTFVFFDDFDDESMSGWSGDTGDFTEADGYIKTSTSYKAIYPTGITTTNHSVDARMKLDTGARGGLAIRKEWGTNTDGQPLHDKGYVLICRYPNSDIFITEGNGGTSHTNLVTTSHTFDANWQDAYIRMSGTAIKDGIAGDELSTTDATYTTGVAYLYTPTMTSGSIYWDDVRVRKYFDPEPVVGTPGALDCLEVGEICYGYIIG